VEPNQDWTWETLLGPSCQEADHRLLGQRPDGHPVEDGDRPCAAHADRVAAGANLQRDQDPDRRILQTTNHERQHPGRGHIQPLDIVDRDGHGTGRSQRAQNCQRRDRHRSLVRWSTLKVRSQERGVQRPLLGAGRSGSSKSRRSPSAA
jgi:hypothetical protein